MSNPERDAGAATRKIVSLPAPRRTRYGVLRAAAFVGDRELPKQSEVLIIGGGIVGAITAYHLAKRGIPVVVCEKAEIACEASSRAFGWVSELLLDPVKQPMTQQSKQMWRSLQDEIGDTGYRSEGLIYLADAEQELEMYSGWLAQSKGLIDPTTRVVTSQEVAARFPTAARRFAGGLLAPSDGSAEPVLATTVIAEAARRAGARIVTDCAVRGLDLQAGRVAGVFTEKGHVAASTVLCAANSWSRLFCGNHGVDIPQLYVIMSMGRTAQTAGPIGAGGQQAWGFRRQIDGSYSLGGVAGVRAPITRDALRLRHAFKPIMEMMGSAKLSFGRDALNDFFLPRRWDPQYTSPFEKLRVLAGRTVDAIARQSLQLNGNEFPEMKGATVAETWSGPVTLTPDNKPIIGTVDSIPGFYIATALSYGITWAPSVGKLLADMMTGAATDYDAAPFRLSRFTDGSKIEVSH